MNAKFELIRDFLDTLEALQCTYRAECSAPSALHVIRVAMACTLDLIDMNETMSCERSRTYAAISTWEYSLASSDHSGRPGRKEVQKLLSIWRSIIPVRFDEEGNSSED